VFEGIDTTRQLRGHLGDSERRLALIEALNAVKQAGTKTLDYFDILPDGTDQSASRTYAPLSALRPHLP
jgi:hypothetical protein